MIMVVGPQLSQWDVGRSVSVSKSNATHIHFANRGDSKAIIIKITNGEAKIPDYLLQTGKPLLAYAVLNGVTLEARSFAVRKRERPSDYVYTETEVLTWTALESRIKALEEGNSGSDDTVLYTEQTLSNEQKAQARKNIGAAAEGECGGGTGLSTEAVSLLLTILSEAIYVSDQSENIQKLKEALQTGGEDEPDEPVIPDEPVTPKLTAPVIRLETDDVPDEPTEPDGKTPAILGVAILGRTILGDYGSDMPKLTAPVIQLVTVSDPVEPEDPETSKLSAPVIRLETVTEPDEPAVEKLTAPVIRLEEVIMVLDAPVIKLVEV